MTHPVTVEDYQRYADILHLFEGEVQYTPKRAKKLFEAWEKLTLVERAKFRFETCRTSFDVERFGRQNGREGKCVLIGGAGHHRGQKPIQIWGVWS
jgi:hypothetical protein